MSIKLNSIDIQNIYLSSNPIQGVYLGNQEIWSNEQFGTFYIDDDSINYNFIIGSTWEEFINSEYNINNAFSIDADDVVIFTLNNFSYMLNDSNDLQTQFKDLTIQNNLIYNIRDVYA